MRLSILSIAAILVTLAACNSQQNKNSSGNDSTSTASKDTVPVTRCYEYIKGKDSVEMKAVYMGDAVSGMLTYKFDGKDRNNGNFTGEVKGDLIVAYYTFFSEGMQSVRQVVFKKEDTGLIEGYGDVYARNDSVFLRSIDSLQFNTVVRLKETPCK